MFNTGPKGQAIMAKLHEELSPIMVRNRRESIPDFPACQTITELVDVGDELAEINKIYSECDYPWGSDATPEKDILTAEQVRRVEHAKTGALLEMIPDHLEAGMSAVVFFSMQESVERLSEELTKLNIQNVWMHGGISSENARQVSIDKFQDNEVHVFIATAACAGASLSLHDIHHARPRVAFLVPSWCPEIFSQSVGRIWRFGGTKAVQKIVLAANSVEETMFKRMSGHLKNMGVLLGDC